MPSEKQQQQQQERESYPDHEPGNEQPVEPMEEEEVDDNASLTSSQADEKDLEEAAGVDMRAVLEEHSGKYVMLFWNICSFVSFALMLTASCPVQWLNDGRGRKWTVWRNVDGTLWSKYGCDHKRQMFQAMQAFAISGCVLSIGCLIAGILQMKGRGHLGVTLLFGVVTMMVELTDWALIVNQYHKYNCAGELAYVARINRLNAGFCLVFISFSLMLFAIVAVGYWMRDTLTRPEFHESRYSGTALFCAFISGSVLTIATVGTAQNMWEHYDTATSLKVTYWHVEIYHREQGLSEHWPLTSYHCPKFTSQMRAGAAFSIISDAFLFLTFLFTVGAVYSRMCKWVAVGLGAASWVFLLVCWAITVAARYQRFCPSGVPITTATIYGAPLNAAEQEVHFTGFVITEGLGMILSAWCITTANIIYFAIKG
ncbi:Amastin surface glycoprotein [Novymonas esmeraldas]|uniref:Amastin surface glycoprotein n=1 Tax=Novymonas esmeraldas TaxID=1808958 RepID=A0AAW0ERP3_9TRYP